MKIPYPKGSEWRKWDLHIHTPKTKLNDQFKLTDQEKKNGINIWHKWFDTLIDNQIECIGATDYFSIDGFTKAIENKTSYLDALHKKGTSQEKIKFLNKLQIFPNLEFRISLENKDSDAINIHILFSNDNKIVEKIPSFLHRLPSENKSCDGKKLYANEITNYSIAIFSLDTLKEHLESNFNQNEYLIIGCPNGYGGFRPSAKDGRSVEMAKNIDSDCNLMFHSTKDPQETVEKIAQSITETKDFYLNQGPYGKNRAKSNLPPKACLLCSDAHCFSAMAENLFTWIKADPTFEGLKQILIEPQERVFIGRTPKKLIHIENNGTKYINSIKIKKRNNSLCKEEWFDCNIPINSGLVTIIGNKGNGKSALSDIIGLLGDTKNFNHFSFLTKRKFRDPKNKLSENFEAELLWESKSKSYAKNLKNDPENNAIEKVKYIPQSFLEEICNLKNDQFETELKKVIFSHLDSKDKHKRETFDKLINYKTTAVHNEIELHKNELSNVLNKILELDKQSTIQHKNELENNLKIKEEELRELEENKPIAVQKPEEKDTLQEIYLKNVNKLIFFKKRASYFLQMTNDFIDHSTNQVLAINKIVHSIENIKIYINNTNNEIENIISNAKLHLNTKEIIQLSYDNTTIETQKEGIEELLQKARTNQEELENKIDRIQRKIDKKNQSIQRQHQKYQEYQHRLQNYETRKKNLTGDISKNGSIEYYKAKIKGLEDIPEKRTGLENNRSKIIRKIYACKIKLKNEYENMYAPVHDYINQHPILKKHFQLKFETSLQNSDFSIKFLDKINKNTSKNFHGNDNSKEVFNEIVEKYNFDDAEKLIECLTEIENKLLYNNDGETLEIQRQLRDGYTGKDIYESLWNLTYIEPHYSLSYAGINITKLSPGQRGSILLIFYLAIDKNNIPIVIDQPEENLDNHTVYKLLVPLIRDAKQKRQIIMVTHNPNIAIVCDAEQVIYAEIDRANANQVTYSAGSIENNTINSFAIDVLEGTRPAFENRNRKYAA